MLISNFFFVYILVASMRGVHTFGSYFKKDILTDLIDALPGNSSVNTVHHAAVDEDVFSVSSAPRQVLLTDKSTLSLTRNMRFLCGLRHATIEGLCFLCVVRAERI
jgi:hypothetical protein